MRKKITYNKLTLKSQLVVIAQLDYNLIIIIILSLMPRPRLMRRIRFNPQVTFYKPQGVPLRKLEVVDLTAEEVEALRLKNVKGFTQIEAAKEMNTSQSTFQRILASAEKKVSVAIIEGKAIRIIKDI